MIMKNLTYSFWFLPLAVVFLASCSKDSLEEMETANLSAEVASVSYSNVELEVLELVNIHRSEKGLSELELLDEISQQADTHTFHMIEENNVCHDNFGNRYTSLVGSIDAQAVSENVAFGFRTAEAVVNAWIKSDGHRKNMEGDHTHFGISIDSNEEGKNYFTNIFVKK